MADVELVIKIPEDVYRNILEIPSSSLFAVDCDIDIRKGIQNGTLLPKGHGRLIDVGDLMPDSDYEDGIFYAVSVGQINDTTTIIEADKAESEE